MEKTREKSFLNIKSKLMAAVAMLLVAFFMVISSSYAWFTLSTAPEVTGIYTAVGANGNLEIALYEGTIPTSNVNDSAIGADGTYNYEKNITWGNIVDLSSKEKYGLNLVSLLPARLAVSDTNDSINPGAPLLAPTYGADGRVSSLVSTLTGKYNSAGTNFENVTGTDSYGVKAIGTSTTMSQQELDFRSAKYDISTYVSLAKKTAANSLNENGSALANLLAAKAMDTSASDAPKSDYDLTFAPDLISELDEANDQIEAALKSYFKAMFAVYSASQNQTEDVYNSAKGNIETTSLDALMNDTKYSTYIYPAIRGAYNKYIANVEAITKAEEALDAITHDLTACTWAEVSGVLITSVLVDIDNAKLNGFTAEAIRQDDNMSILVNKVMSDGAIVTLESGAGVYSNIAEVCGNYEASIVIPEINYGGVRLENMKAKMSTKIDNDPLHDIYGATNDITVPTVDSNTAKLTDFYGYAIDLAFRTNVEGSNLQLQTDEVNRIYSDGGSQETMGHGSTMTFTPTTTDFSTVDVANLMSAIRIVFTDKEGKILAVACLDTSEAELDYNGTTVTAYVKLVKYNIVDKLLTVQTTTTGEGESAVETFVWEDDSIIMPLDKNAVEVLSAYVYLDGDKVENSDVANAASSMTGSLNLQFSSSATLVPMPYSPLQDQTASTTTSSSTPTT